MFPVLGKVENGRIMVSSMVSQHSAPESPPASESGPASIRPGRPPNRPRVLRLGKIAGSITEIPMIPQLIKPIRGELLIRLTEARMIPSSLVLHFQVEPSSSEVQELNNSEQFRNRVLPSLSSSEIVRTQSFMFVQYIRPPLLFPLSWCSEPAPRPTVASYRCINADHVSFSGRRREHEPFLES